MDCQSCDAGSERADRPHTFLLHEPSHCEACGRDVEARIVLRDGEVFALKFCPPCGQTEAKVSDDADAYVRELIAHGDVPANQAGDHLFKHTTSTCPECLDLVQAKVVIRSGQVFFKKDCAKCGPSEALVSEDSSYYVRAYGAARAGTEPHKFGSTVKAGCPTDCGTCGDHEQHTCLPIIEITDHCNLECPVCIVNNQYSNHMTTADFSKVIDRLIEAEGTLESIALSGGEPTSHPLLLDLIRIATRDEIGRIVIITNGLQLDGFSPETHEKIRGRDLTDEKNAALLALEELDIPTQLIFVAARGINEHQIGQAVELLLAKDHILSLNFQPVAHTGRGGGNLEHDPMDRLTIPGVIRRIDEQTHGKLKTSDFTPLPCSHPQCVSLTYILRLDDGSYLPFARFADFKKHGNLLRSSATLASTREMHDILQDVIYDVFADQDKIERGADALRALRRTVDVMFPDRLLTPHEAIRIGEQQAKSIFLHHYMDRHDFDLERLRKCCHHYAQVDGRLMPACGFNMFHRGAAKGESMPLSGLGTPPSSTPYLSGSRSDNAEPGTAKARLKVLNQ